MSFSFVKALYDSCYRCIYSVTSAINLLFHVEFSQKLQMNFSVSIIFSKKKEEKDMNQLGQWSSCTRSGFSFVFVCFLSLLKSAISLDGMISKLCSHLFIVVYGKQINIFFCFGFSFLPFFFFFFAYMLCYFLISSWFAAGEIKMCEFEQYIYMK